MELNILFVEDDPNDLRQITEIIKNTIENKSLKASIKPIGNFDDGIKEANNPHVIYDLIITDTYKGEHKNKDKVALEIVKNYRQGKFCPIVLCSSGECPADLETSAFVNWADKSIENDIQNKIVEILDIGLPQIVRSLHDIINKSAGNFLWSFLEKNWSELNKTYKVNKESLERLIKRRAAIQIADIDQGYTVRKKKHAFEYYIYPNFDHKYYSLGDIIQNKSELSEFRVILTPHCHLITQENDNKPKADYILTVKTVSAKDILGEKLKNSDHKKLEKWSRSPAQTDRKPEGRHWYLPEFLKIPHLFCDFLQIESLPIDEIKSNYKRLATLTAPYAEALQQCFTSFYSNIGIPIIETKSIENILINKKM